MWDKKIENFVSIARGQNKHANDKVCFGSEIVHLTHMQFIIDIWSISTAQLGCDARDFSGFIFFVITENQKLSMNIDLPAPSEHATS